MLVCVYSSAEKSQGLNHYPDQHWPWSHYLSLHVLFVLRDTFFLLHTIGDPFLKGIE
jgi:hypothetical protein